MKIFKLYYLFFLASFILLMLCFFYGEETFDVNVHDTYFVIAHGYMYGLFSILLFFFFTIYITLDKAKVVLFKLLTKIHIFGTLVSILVMFFPYSIAFLFAKFPLSIDFQLVNIFLTIGFLLFLFLQLLFIINIFVSLIKKMRLLRASQ
jgi:heme/copper-type cytochrome/quinol oxidase subunit 1